MQQSARTSKQIGAIIRRVRRNAGLTQAELGEKVGRRQATISKLEKGEPATQIVVLLDALTALGLEMVIDKRGKVSNESLEDLF
jgi:HTH-type transcriptional regulator/antitoxin HipB